MNMQEGSLRARSIGIAGLLWVVLPAHALAAAPEDQVAGLKRELLALAKSVGPPSEKSPEAPPQAVQTILAAGDWEFRLQFAAKIGNEQSKANALVAILGKVSDLRDQNQARATLGRVAKVAGGIGNDTARARVLAGCAAAATKLGDAAQGRDLLARALDSTSRISDDASKARVLASLAETSARLEPVGQGHTLLDEALHAADSITDNATKALVLTGDANS